ncbi:MAG: hypothetical protein A2958_00605 [Candidatus Levybacteria bacterium RIFCSPLOWO2_01_FULL_38_13]|nr:MAG: hypothetical protein A2629_00500 [Candidatus Levybacteria bacterium RIFCSPHIGHO2_01_FULL_41_15]OGH34789.1 MAG: hypothetical protein A2958_00605 [Candidatus Levybacteria bacterium RIFCSPLOWO2_01_FULL_38_13]
MKLKKLIKDYLEEAKLMQLSTCVDNQPWVCHVWFAADENLNIYWFSSTTRRHSREVMKNPKVSAAIVLPHTPEDIPRGLQLEGDAQLLTDEKDIQKARSVYEGRIFSKKVVNDLIKSKDSPHKFYKIKPRAFVLFDLVNFPENPRQELEF